MLQSGDDPLKTLGGRIKAARKAKGIRAGKAATAIGISRTSLSQWEADAVKNPDIKKLGEFVKLVDVNLDWLVERKGSDPDLTMPVSRRRRQPLSLSEMMGGAPIDGSPLGNDLPIPEVAAPLSAHTGSEMDRTPRDLWVIPGKVLEIAFNTQPEHAVIKRIVSRSARAFGLSRGDYVLIDIARTRIDEPGIYLVADPDGKSARRALVVEKDGKLAVSVLEDDLQRSCPQPTVDNLTSLGRVMGIFKPV